MLIEREAKHELETALGIFPAVALLGPRQVGKTTLAKSLRPFGAYTAAEYFDLENPTDRVQVAADPLSFFRLHAHAPIVLDEIHRVPEIFPVLRGVIDDAREKGPAAGRFLLLGSASMDLLKQTSESLAGRIGYVELSGFTAREIASTDPAIIPSIDGAGSSLDRLWLTGGFPQSFLAASLEASFAWRSAFIRTYAERDVPLFGLRVPSETIERFLAIMAHSQGAVLNAARIAAALDMSATSVKRYIGFLESLLLMRTLRPYVGNIGKRLVKSPKIYLRDSGIVHTLLGIRSVRDLLSHPVLGASYEGFVIENLIAAAGSHVLTSFYRTSAGAEIDLVIERGAETIAIEIKRTLAPKLSPGFVNGCADIGATKRFFVYPGNERFPLGADTEAIPLVELMNILSQQ